MICRSAARCNVFNTPLQHPDPIASTTTGAKTRKERARSIRLRTERLTHLSVVLVKSAHECINTYELVYMLQISKCVNNDGWSPIEGEDMVATAWVPSCVRLPWAHE